MKYFTCIVRWTGDPVPNSVRSRHVPSRLLGGREAVDWVADAGFAAIAQPLEVGLGPNIARRGTRIAVGDVRLDHREVVARWAGIPEGESSDLDLVLASVERLGARCVPDLLGDFAFVVWDTRSRELLAARDAFGLASLYYAESGDFLVLSSRPSIAAGNEERYNLEFIADFLVSAMDPTERNPFAGVTTLPCGCIMSARNGSVRTTQYWSADRFEPDGVGTEGHQVETFRQLFSEAVRVRIAGVGDNTWSQLSGGLDSSSVVSMSQALYQTGRVPSGLAGTITFVDSLSDGDEREFVQAVTQRWGVKNEQFIDCWYWQDDGHPPPLTEAPALNYPLYARDRLSCELIRSRGGRVLLTGQGGDQYLSGMPLFIADLLTQRHWQAAAREALRWSVMTRDSFWKLAFYNGVLPLLPPSVGRKCLRRHESTPLWVESGFARRLDLARRNWAFSILRVPRGQKYVGAVALQVNHYGRYNDVSLFDQWFQLRHPFLYRPLVEFSLRLPPSLRTRPLAQKWVLREAMRGILPDHVRTRTGKGGSDGRIAWSLARERDRIKDLLDDPILGQLGCIDVKRLRATIGDVRSGQETYVAALMDTLSLETWLRVRSGRWPVPEGASREALQRA